MVIEDPHQTYLSPPTRRGWWVSVGCLGTLLNDTGLWWVIGEERGKGGAGRERGEGRDGMEEEWSNEWSQQAEEDGEMAG